VDDRHRDKFFQLGNHYAMQCFDYIHNNPVKAGMVNRPEDWEFSSARDYAGLRNGTLCNYELAREVLDF
jgi:putative transposase